MSRALADWLTELARSLSRAESAQQKINDQIERLISRVQQLEQTNAALITSNNRLVVRVTEMEQLIEFYAQERRAEAKVQH